MKILRKNILGWGTISAKNLRLLRMHLVPSGTERLAAWLKLSRQEKMV